MIGVKAPDGTSFSHNMEWLVASSVAAIETAVTDGDNFFLHFAPTAPHTPSVAEALAMDSRRTPAGELAEAPTTTMPDRSQIKVRVEAAGFNADSRRGDSWLGTVWSDDGLGALMDKTRELGV